MEQWLPVVGHEGSYEVSDQGRVRSVDRIISDWPSDLDPEGRRKRLRKGRTLKGWVHKGYLVVGIKRQSRQVHHLVLESFVGPRPEGLVCRHLDGNHLNNHVSNLRWGTYSENSYDTVDHGRNRNAAKTQCPQGHEYTPENTRITTRRGRPLARRCRICQNRYRREARRRGVAA